ncbi:MAG: entericidin A/B family lipoprotein [Verrucomicrobiota bacterium]
MKGKALLSLLLLAAAFLFSACNTMRGVGQDVQSLGRNLERSAVKAGSGGAPPAPPAY